MNAYEITYIVRPDGDEEQTRGAIDQITRRFEAAGSEILAVVPWNPPRRRMAYPIRDFGDGYYVTTVFRVQPDALPPIENGLKLNDRILRYLLVQATETNIKAAQQRVQQAAAAAAAAAAPRPEAPAPVPATAIAPAPAPQSQTAAEPESAAPASTVSEPVAVTTDTTTEE